MEAKKPAVPSRDEIKSRVKYLLKVQYRKTTETATKQQLYNALAFAVKDYISDLWIATHENYEREDVKVVYYLSMEFLMGRFLGNAVINLMLRDAVGDAMDELGADYLDMEEQEADPGLGNGGLGRLAACFLDSLTTLGYPAYGCGIRYNYGLFEQRIENGYQIEKPDYWLKNGDPWGVRRDEYTMEIKFGGRVNSIKDGQGNLHYVLEGYKSVKAVPYDYPVVGYNTGIVNTLRLWDAEAIDKFDLQSFNQGDYRRAVEEDNQASVLSEVLYPADDFIEGKELRLKQQYFFISATLQRVTARFISRQKDFSCFSDFVQFQLNDTHPTLAVAELMRILLDVYNVEWEEAWGITQKACAYTNHTIMSEALEKWPIDLFSRLLPRIYMIVEEINRRFCEKLTSWFGNKPEKIRNMAIIADGKVRMAYLAIAGSHSVNGVAAIHTDILKTQELKDFYEIYPDKFNNKTNGITQRRWLAHSNPGLSSLITKNIGDGWITDLFELKKLLPLAGDGAFQKEFRTVKRSNKASLSNYIKTMYDIDVDPDSIFDVQVKRMHEYKRQLLNIFHIMDLYNTFKLLPNLDIVPRTFIFGGKSAASYKRTKLIIKLITSVANVVNNDRTIDGRIKIVFMENYRVSQAERIIPAADVSEQISTAGKEASGTGNMKFMLNGAVTIGTMDGANVEIHEEVGDDNIFIFGMTADEVLALTKSRLYAPWDIYNMDFNIRYVLTSLINGTFERDNNELFRELYDAMLNGFGGARPDEYYVLQDFQSYKAAQQKVNDAYKDAARWNEMSIRNVAGSGKFSSDRTIRQYADEIWNIKPVAFK
ncbi:MAG: glycogen/starch/alpha-glucan phosphorylase [Defluviitaleaceae bacterium]|nr:glycogen/starch/alpha-glucan phosphorylase [Defluviitaleaceae bacterium]